VPLGDSQQALKAYFNTTPFQTTLLPGTTIGRYDGRVSLSNSDSRLQSDTDPSGIKSTPPIRDVSRVVLDLCDARNGTGGLLWRVERAQRFELSVLPINDDATTAQRALSMHINRPHFIVPLKST
jgi:hypothetical protein